MDLSLVWLSSLQIVLSVTTSLAASFSSLDASIANITLSETSVVPVPGQYRILRVVIYEGSKRFNQGTAIDVHTQMNLIAASIDPRDSLHLLFPFYGIKTQFPNRVEVEFFNLAVYTGIPLRNIEAYNVFGAVINHFRTNDMRWAVFDQMTSIAEGQIRLLKG